MVSLFESLGPRALPLNPVPVKALQGQIEELKSLPDKNTVVSALTRSVSGPAGIFDPYAALPAFCSAETLVHFSECYLFGSLQEV